MRDRVKELRAGFEDLVTGLVGLAEDLERENAELRARLDERRLVVVAARPPVETPSAVTTPRVDSTLIRHRKATPYEHPCVRCATVFLGKPTRQLCPACFKAAAYVRARKRKTDTVRLVSRSDGTNG